MTPDRWRKVNEIFHAVLDRSDSPTEEFLRAECGDDPDLYSEIRQMLREHKQTGFLDEAAWPDPDSSFARVFADGEIVSERYRIVGLLGRGGMGEVYESEDLELHEPVALKALIPAIAGDARMIARFKQEIQLSRKISHPGVCRVFDLARHSAGGSGPNAIYFLTMELLRGETLSERLRREGRIPAAQALPLLRQMADALDAAHGSGVIHRDFKPANVMLVPGPEGARAVVNDFGLARRVALGTSASQTENLMGTYDYMAPELFAGQAGSVASDVYALGTVAFQMLAGALSVSHDGGPAPALRSLAPELDSTWERAIARARDPEPTRRQRSAGDFVKELAGEPPAVRVILPAVSRRGLLTGAVALLVVAAGTFAWRSRVHLRDQPSAEAVSFYRRGVDNIQSGAYFAATKALEEATRVAPRFSLAHARLAEAWVELYAPERASHEMLLARREDISGLSELDRLQIEAIDLTITREFPAAIAKYLQMNSRAADTCDLDLGRAYEKAGQRNKAIESYRRAADGPSHPPAAWLRLAILYSRASDSNKAAEAFGRAEDLYRIESNLEGSIEVAYQRGIDANRRGKYEEGATHLRKALETARLAANSQQEISATFQLATTAYMTGDAALAERYARESIEKAQANQIDFLAISGLVNLGNTYFRKRDFAAAEKYYWEGLALARHNSAHRLAALCLLSLASLHDQVKRPEDMAREATEALNFYQSSGFAYESYLCLTLLGRRQRDRGDFTAALDLFQQSLRMAEKSQDQPGMALAHASLGSLLAAQDRYPEALEHYQKGLELSSNDQPKGYARLQCGGILWQLGRYDEARAMFDAAEGYAEKFPALKLNIARARADMALSEGKGADAATLVRRALRATAPGDVVTIDELKQVLGLALLASGNKHEGRRLCESFLSGKTAVDDAAALRTARLAALQARLETGDRAGSLALFRQLEPTLAGHPEHRWRAFALLALSDGSYAAPAGQALDDLARQWGDAAYRGYLTRPDVRRIAWPLLRANAAKP